MADVAARYMQEVARQWGYLATWLPGRTVAPGQTGRFDGMQVDVDGHVDRELGMSIEIESDPSVTELAYRSAGAVELRWTSSVATISGERAAVEIGFRRENAIVLDLHRAVETRMANAADVKARILEEDRRSGWPRDRAFVVSVVTAERATIMISSSADSQVVCDAQVGQALGNLADPQLGLSLTSEKAMHTTLVSAGALTPMYQALVLRRGLTGSRSMRKALRGVDAMDASDPLRSVVDEDFVLCTVNADEAPD